MAHEVLHLNRGRLSSRARSREFKELTAPEAERIKSIHGGILYDC